MKIHKNIFNALLVAACSIASTQLSAQKVEFETIEINYGDISVGPSGYKSLRFMESTSVSVSGSMGIQNDKKEYTGKVTFSGLDQKGNAYSSGYEFTLANGNTDYKGKISIKASKENPVYISHVTLSVANANKEIASETEPILIPAPKTSFAILLNGIKGNEYCNEVKINQAFSDETIGAKYFAIVIGLNSTKEEQSTPELELSQGHGTSVGVFTWTSSEKTFTHRVKPTSDKNGNWYYSDSVVYEKESTQLKDFRIEYITACNDTFTYVAAYKEKLADSKYYDYALSMQSVAYDNPLYEGINQGGTNVLALTLPSSSISISGGSFEVRDNSSFTLGFGNVNVGSQNSISTVQIAYTDARNKTHVFNTTWNGKTGYYEAKTSVNGSEKGPYIIQSFAVYVVLESKDTLVFESKGKLAEPIFGLSSLVLMSKSKTLAYKDPCDNKYKLKEIEYSETTVSGNYTMQFSFALEGNSDVPASVAMIVEIMDCNGKKDYVQITLRYNAKTNTYTGGESLTQNKECPWTLTYGEIAAYNACKEKTVWSFETGKSKSNGSGTRNVATTNNGKPALL